MWEISHPFSYTAPAFVDGYARALAALDRGGVDEALAIRRSLQQTLSNLDRDYLTWQEWKEGLARLIESRIRAALTLPENRGGRAAPFDPVSFYAGGAALIAALSTVQEDLLTDLAALLAALRGGPDTGHGDAA